LRLLRRGPRHAATLSIDEALRLVPAKNPLVEEDKSRPEELALRLKLQRTHSKLQRILPIPGYRTFILDKIGSFVWEKIDGENSVGVIALELAKNFKMTREEAEISLLRYIQMLASRGLVFLRRGDEGEANA